MQTFLPYPSFARSAAVLDHRRLGKQRVEALQIVRALTRTDYGWQHHPAVLMWRDHEEALVAYGSAVCEEWCRRGSPDTCLDQMLGEIGLDSARSQRELRLAGALPPWLGRRAFHRSHRSALVRKQPEWYGPLFPGVPADLAYVWPVRARTPRGGR
jgi:pyrimidine dimer DNA glycosylase